MSKPLLGLKFEHRWEILHRILKEEKNPQLGMETNKIVAFGEQKSRRRPKRRRFWSRAILNEILLPKIILAIFGFNRTLLRATQLSYTLCFAPNFFKSPLSAAELRSVSHPGSCDLTLLFLGWVASGLL